VIPFISGEEMQTEPQKLLGKWAGNRFIDAGLSISAHCNRVAVVDGLTECVSVHLKKTVTIGEVGEALRIFKCPKNSHRCRQP
jgi:aspartate-semialdehyde dehydrogenase